MHGDDGLPNYMPPTAYQSDDSHKHYVKEMKDRLRAKV